MSASIASTDNPTTDTATTVRPGSPRAWLLASRPATLTAAFVPVAVGTACAFAVGALRWDTALAALLGAFGIQIGTNFANDVFDAEKGADTEERLGPTRAVQAGLIGARAMRAGMVAAFGFATLAGLYLVAHAGWPIVAIGVASIASGIAYTGGPFPLGYHGLGDVFVMLFFGFVAVCGTAFVQVGAVPELAWWASVPVGAIATAILVVNNLRDRATDVKAGKRTLAVRFGRAGAEVEYGLLVLASYATPVALWLRGLAGPFVMLPLLTLPLALRLFAQLRAREGAPLNATLAGTARLLLGFGVLFAVGIALA
jgi:1,4-dihydroxy-2-naphthoate polyprenyltransferase